MRCVGVILCLIGLLTAASSAVAAPPLRLTPSAAAAPSAGQSSQPARTQRATSSQNGTTENGSSGKGEDSSDSNGSGKNGAQTSSGTSESESESDEVDTSDIFGFTEGSDTSDKDTRVLTHDVVGRSGRRHGFGGLRGSLSVLYSPSERLQVSLSVDADYEQQRFDPLGVELRGSLGYGLSGSAKYRIWEREKDSVIGLAVTVSPYWLRASELTGGTLERFGTEVRLIADHEIVLKKLFVALNLAFNPESQSWPDGSRTQTSHVEASGAVSVSVTNSLYVGAELRYLAHYDGALFGRFDGWALFAGPTIYASLSENAYVGAAWSMQVAGGATAEPGQNFDLVHFERHQFRLKSGIVF